MSLPKSAEEIIKTVVEVYAYNPDNIDHMVKSACALCPDVHPDIIRNHILGKVCYDESDEYETYEEDEPISEEDMANALEMGDKQSSIDYLKILYFNLSRETIERRYEAAVAKERKRTLPARRQESMKFEVTDVDASQTSKRKRKSEMEFDVADVDAPPKSKKRLANFDDKTTTPDEPAVSYTPPTPPLRGGAYDPIDFSPSTYGAAGPDVTRLFEARRATLLPHLPARSPRFRNEFLTPPRPPRSGTSPLSSRRLRFSDSSSDEWL